MTGKVRKFSAKQIRYLWAIGYLKSSPYYKGPQQAQMSLKTGTRQDSTSTEKPQPSTSNEVPKDQRKKLPVEKTEEMVAAAKPEVEKLAKGLQDRLGGQVKVSMNTVDPVATMHFFGRNDLTSLYRDFVPEHPELTGKSVYFGLSHLAKEDGTERIQMRATVKDPETGRELFHVDRTYVKRSKPDEDFEGAQFWADHSSFSIDSSLQGKGIGKRAFESQVALAKRAGLTHIFTSANCDVGGYMWAKEGYNFRYSDEAQHSSASLYRNIKNLDTSKMSESDRKRHEDIIAKLTKIPGKISPLTAKEIADLEFTVDGKRVRSGPQTLLGTSWSGVKRLSDVN